MVLRNSEIESSNNPQFSTPHLDTKVSVYSSIFYDKTPTQTTLRNILKTITDKTRKSKFEYLRSLEKKAYDIEKPKLRAFTVSGTFAGGHSMENLTSYTGLMQLDFDKLSNNEVIRAKKVLRKLPFVLAVFDTVKGRNGIKAIAVLNNSDAKKHTKYYKDLAKYFSDNHDLKLDKQCCDYTRCFFIPYSDFCFVNETAKPYDLKYNEKKEIAKKPQKQHLGTKKSYQKGKYIFINEYSANIEKLDKISSFHMRYEDFIQGNRHAHATKFALWSHKMDIPLQEAESYYYANYDKKKCNAFTFEYENNTQNKGTYEYPKYKQINTPQESTPKKSFTKNQPLFFKTAQASFNTLDGKKSVIETSYLPNDFIEIPTQKIASKNYDRKDYENATFNAEILEQIKELEVSKIVLLHDKFALQNLNKEFRALKHFAKVKAFYFACKNAKIPFFYSNGAGADTAKQIQNSLNLAYVKGIFEKSVHKFYQIDKYLSEIDSKLNDMLLSENQTFILDSPTGTGKNDTFYYLISKAIKTHPHRKFFVCYPSNFANEAKYNEYSNSNNNWRGLELKILTIDQYTDSDIKANLAYHIAQADIVQFVPNSYKFVADFIDKNSVIIYDEMHKSVTQHTIAPLKEINSILESNATKILMTGTPFDSFAKEYKIQTIRVQRNVNNNVNLQCIELSDKTKKSNGFNHEGSFQAYGKTAMNFISSITENERKGKVFVIYLNHKKILNKLKKHVENCGMIADVVYSDIDVKMNSEAYSCLTNAKAIPMTADAPSKIILATSIAYESVNLINASEQIGRIAMFGEKYTANVIQSIARPRNATDLNVYYFLTQNEKKNIPYSEKYELFQEVAKCAYNDCKKIIEIERLASEIESKELKEVANSIKNNLETKYYTSDISQLVTDAGQMNKLKVVSMYEAQKAEQETNLQKFESLAKCYENTTSQKLDISETATLFIDSDSIIDNEKLKELARIATENEAKYNEIIANEKEQKKDLKERISELLSENVVYTLALFLDKDVKFNRHAGHKNKLFDILSKYESHVLLSEKYNQFKAKVYILNNRLFFKHIAILAKRISKLSQYIDVSKEKLENGSIGKMLAMSSNQFNSLIMKMDTMKAIENDAKTDKDVLNCYMYNQIYKHEKIEFGKAYTRDELINIAKSVYNKKINNEVTDICKFKPIRLNDKKHIDTIKTLFIWSEMNTKYYCDKAQKKVRKRKIVLISKNSYLEVLKAYGIF